MLESLLERFHGRDRLALARLLSLIARGEQLDAIRIGAGPVRIPRRVVAVTGSAGVGKSTLIGKMIECLRGRGQTVAVLACDPQSPLSGGALLGDRFRMPSPPEDDGVFIRSLAAVSGHGAVAQHLQAMIHLLEVFGFDLIFIETVGAGQGDTAVRELADVVVLLLQPETGDDLQWEKAGLLEVADIIVIHKADLPGAERVEADVKATLKLPGAKPVRVLRVSAKDGSGIEDLCRAIQEAAAGRQAAAHPAREVLQAAQDRLTAAFARATAAGEPRLIELVDEYQKGTLPAGEAADRLLRLLVGDSTASLRQEALKP